MDIEKLISELTLEEKASLVSGHDAWRTEPIERLGIPYIFMSDGPHGVRKEIGEIDAEVPNRETIDAVCFPTACATSASFDRELMRKLGVTLGKECQAENVSTILGPAINIKRSPLCGRNFEYVSEDPYVAGELSAAYIEGVQSQGVGTSVKHFAANSQETERMYADSVMDERTLREIYLAAFETAVKKSSPATIMASYNRVNGTYASENKKLLTDILRKEWGFDGVVMSDWGAVSDRVKGIDAGLDLEMPGCGGRNDEYIIESVKNGKLSMEALDAAVRNVLKWVDDSVKNSTDGEFDRDKDHIEAVRAEEECIVLLQNLEPQHSDEKVLPLKKDEKILFVGGFAAAPRYQGGGSSHINSHEVTSAVSVMKNFSENITYIEGFPADSDVMDDASRDAVLEAAPDYDKVVVFAGLPDSYESEGYDRTHMRLPDCQNELVEELIYGGSSVVVVLHNGSPVEMPWVDYVDGIVEAYLGGEGVGEAVMNVLYGNVNPSGHLAETFPIILEDTPSHLNFPVANHKVNYAEGVFVGYRYYDTKCMDVLFPFGYGLSYTDFELSDMRIVGEEDAAGDEVTVDISNGAVIRVDVENVGGRAGKTVVQLYIADKTMATNRPVHELKGFEKVSLEPGEKKTVEFKLDARSFQWWSEQINDWYAANGEYVIQIGFSSRDIIFEGSVMLTGSKPLPMVIDADLQLGELMANPKTAQYVKERLGQITTQFGGDNAEHETAEMVEAMIRYMPIRTLRSFCGLTNKEIDEILEELKKLV